MPSPYAHPDWHALVAAIRANPADDLPRLVAADWLDEHGEAERAAFIRVQCELVKLPNDGVCEHAFEWKHPQTCRTCELRWQERRARGLAGPGQTPPNIRLWFYDVMPAGVVITHIRRGFLTGVKCRLADWFGGLCRQCGDEGRRGVDFGPGWRNVCTTCRGEGGSAGIGPAVVAAHPVGRLAVSDATPYPLQSANGETGPRGWGWWDGAYFDPATLGEGELPTAVFELIWEAHVANRRVDRVGRNVLFDTEEDAEIALSAALIEWALAQPAPVLS
jgi:uncharacterized protein (TIGR02996 family)